ncbi:MAG TPA: AraC family transcriptional regulator, partial [Acidobacteriaceae bacterium]|nr:AraC family transcriptional regulator [Acidobacteriaceae bacterium]
IDDPVVRHLLSSLLPAMARPSDASSLFLDHVALALTAHLAHTYGGVVSCGSRRGGLAPHLERRAKERMTADLREDLSLAGLAAECGLSARHFARAFRQSTGLAPHRWIVEHRIERARNLLASREMSLSDVALACGFADQSHFTRCFAARVGMSPGAWRRMHAASGQTMADENPTTDALA